jgi:hypothetical protein
VKAGCVKACKQGRACSCVPPAELLAQLPAPEANCWDFIDRIATAGEILRAVIVLAAIDPASAQPHRHAPGSADASVSRRQLRTHVCRPAAGGRRPGVMAFIRLLRHNRKSGMTLANAIARAWAKRK